ncbi:MAG: glycoside hydrolase family 38 N-terminal domain-containing protein, partial [Thermoguttaceae bacterium]
MMNLNNSTVVLPCHSLEDLSVDRSSAEADQILSAWSAFYHPALILQFRGPPGWRGTINAPSPPTGHLIVIPPCCEEKLPAGWLDGAANYEAVVIRGCSTRNEVLAQALTVLENPSPEASSPELVPDFLALGYCHLLVELLTRQLRYMSNLDEVAFRSSALSAATRWAEGDADAAREHLTSAFDLLTEAREYFYPVETHLLDLTLVAPTTLGPPLDAALARKGPINLLLSGATLEAMARQAPDTLARIRQALAAGELSILGGEFEERQLPLLGPETLLAQFRRGRQAYHEHLGQPPAIFCRRRFGLSPLLPQVLRRFGFVGACHFTLDDGRFPTGNQSRIKWEGASGAAIDSLVRLPADASRGRAFLALAERLGSAMDLDHAATAVFAHWPGGQSPWYDDLFRGCGYSPVFGRFFSIDEYFKSTRYVGQATRYPADGYRSPFLRQAVAAKDPAPLSQWQQATSSEVQAQADSALQTMAALLGGPDAAGSPDTGDHLHAIRDGLAPAPASADPRPGCLLVNPFSFTRNIPVDLSSWDRLPALGDPVVAAAETAGRKTAVVAVPGMGFAWIQPAVADPAAPPRPAAPRRRWFGANRQTATPPMADENVLRNDFFEVRVDPATGALRSVHDYRTRDNRLAMQLAFRRAPHPESGDEDEAESLYTVMAADDVSVRSAGPLLGELAVRGRLLDPDGACVARYEQAFRARRGSRVLEVDVALRPERLPDGDPWKTYFAARFAWSDSTAEVHRCLGTVTVPVEATHVETPWFVDVRSEKIHTTIFTAGLPWHRHLGPRKLDTLLIVPGETQRQFRLGVGIDVPYPFAAATELLAPATQIDQVGPPPGPTSGWLFHLNARNVVATAWEPLFDGPNLRGLRVRLAETENRQATLTLQSCRPIARARRTDFLGEQPEELAVET